LHCGIDKQGNNCIASCNLTSIPLRNFVTKKINRNLPIEEAIRDAFNFPKLGIVTPMCVENIDNVVDETRYALDKYDEKGNLIPQTIHLTNKRNRPLGIGTQGFAEMLFEMDLRIIEDKEYVIPLNKFIFGSMHFNAVAKSVDLAIKKGAYSTFKSSPMSEGKLQPDLWRDEVKIRNVGKDHPGKEPELDPKSWGQKDIVLSNGYVITPNWESLREAVRKFGVRNSTLFAMMPTATSSQISRNTETNEMCMSNLYNRKILKGNYPVLNRYLYYDFKELNIWNRYTFDYIQSNDGSIKGLDNFIRNISEHYEGFDNFDRLKFLINKYQTMYECSQKYMLKLSADRSMYICNSSSQNIYFKDPQEHILIACHLYSHEIGLKNLMYYLRQEASLKQIKFALDPEMAHMIREASNGVRNLETPETRESSDEEYVVCDPNDKNTETCDPNDKNCTSCGS
jgi:ribonucleoside-diphosphate reductase subunit M1